MVHGICVELQTCVVNYWCHHTSIQKNKKIKTKYYYMYKNTWYYYGVRLKAVLSLWCIYIYVQKMVLSWHLTKIFIVLPWYTSKNIVLTWYMSQNSTDISKKTNKQGIIIHTKTYYYIKCKKSIPWYISIKHTTMVHLKISDIIMIHI